nr:hypothetical protein [uncultured Flavobacterium sp.]
MPFENLNNIHYTATEKTAVGTWCLLKNHFHILVRIKDKTEIEQKELTYTTTEKPKIIDPSRQFSHLFNAYTQAINKRHNRTGSLFETTFERKLVSSEKYFQQLIFYIHNPLCEIIKKEQYLMFCHSDEGGITSANYVM